MTAYFHGGAPGLRWIEPPIKTGAPGLADYGAAGVCRRDRVYVTIDPDAALMYAAMHPSGRGVVYEVKPLGELTHDPDCVTMGYSFECERAEVVKAHKIKVKELRRIRRMVLA